MPENFRNAVRLVSAKSMDHGEHGSKTILQITSTHVIVWRGTPGL